MATRLERFRKHCTDMSFSAHRLDCPSLVRHLTEPPSHYHWRIDRLDEDGMPSRLGWYAEPPRPWAPATCSGCLSAADRDLFARLANEVDTYIDATLEDA